MIVLHTALLILLGAVLDYSGLKVDGFSFWVVLFIILAIFLSYDILMSRNEEDVEEDKE